MRQILTPYGIERFEAHKRRGSQLWAWVRTNRYFVIAQAICLALAPVIIWLSELDRGYRAYGSEMLLVVAPCIYRFFRWVVTYDDRDRR